MKPIEIAGTFIMVAFAVSAVGCTWVALTPEGRNIGVLQDTEVTECQKIGKTTSTTATRVVFFPRGNRKVREELESLARNEAAEMGGDAIVPIETPVSGRQSFEMYRCETR